MAKIEVELANGAKAGSTLQELTKEASKLNKEISKLPIGSDDFIQKSKQLQQVSGNVAEVRNQIKGTTEASNALRNQFNQFIPFSGTFSQIGEQVGGVKKGVGGLTSTMGTLRGAIVATGLGAFVVLLGLIINYLTSTQEGMDKVTSVTRPLVAIFDRLKGVLQELGGKLFKMLGDAIKNPKQAFIDLGNAIKENIISRFEALALFGPAIAKIFRGEIAGGFKDLGNAVIQAGTGIKNGIDKIAEGAKDLADFVSEAAKQGSRLDELQKQIERAEIKQITRSKELELLIKQQKAIVEDETKSYQEREAAAAKALDVQQEALNMELSLIDKKIEKMKLQHSLNDTSREDEKALAELQAKRLDLQARTTEQSIEFDKKITELRNKQAQEEEAQRKKQTEAWAKYYKDLEGLEDSRIALMKDSREKDLELLRVALQRQIEEIDINAPLYAERVAAAQDLARLKRQEINDKWDAQEAQKKIEAQELEFATEQNILNERLLNKQITEEQFLTNSEQSAIAFQKRKLDIIKELHSQESAEYQRAYAEFLQLQQAQADRAVDTKKQEMSDQLAAMQGSLGTFGSFFSQVASMQKQGSAQWKTFATASAIMSTIQGAINAYTSTAAIPIVGPFLAPVAAGVALAAGYANVRQIQRTKPEAPIKARRGLVLRGPSHEHGGIPIEAEGDEIILTKGVYRNPYLRSIASQINVAAGGRKFEAGGPVGALSPAIQTRGSIATPSDTVDATKQNNQAMARLESSFNMYAEKIDTWARTIKVQNVVTETEDALKTVNAIREEADV